MENSFDGSASFVVQAREIHGGVHARLPHDRDPVDEAAAELARLVLAQWREEAGIREVSDPAPLPVEWRADHELADHRANVGAHLSDDDSLVRLAAAFRALPRQRLAVLGGPGAGKTTFVMLLVQQLLVTLEPGQPVPVLLSVASWDPSRERLGSWLVRRIDDEYPGLRVTYGRSVVERLVRDFRVLPVLDGLDELPQPLRRSALERLNQAGAVIVTCRTDEYPTAVDHGVILQSAAVLRAMPLSPQTVVGYLRTAVPPGRLPLWEPVFEAMAAGSVLAETLSAPLMVWLARRVHRAADPKALLEFDERDAIEKYLLDGLVPAVFSEPESRWHPEQAARWLRFLAGCLSRTRTEDIAWWRLGVSAQFGEWTVLATTTAVVVVVLAESLAEGHFLLAVSSDAAVFIEGMLIALPVWLCLEMITGGMAVARAPSGRAGSLSLRRRARSVGADLRQRPLSWLISAVISLAGALTVAPQMFAVPGLVGSFEMIPLLLLTALIKLVLMSPADTDRAVDPDRLASGDLRALSWVVLVVAPIVTITLTRSWISEIGIRESRPAVIGCWTGCTVVAALSSASGRWRILNTALVVIGRLPWSAMVFLRDAHRMGVLRRVGSVYQFRHVRLRESLTPPDGPHERIRPILAPWDGRPSKAGILLVTVAGTLLTLISGHPPGQFLQRIVIGGMLMTVAHTIQRRSR